MLEKILHWPFFTRCWIIQEVCLAKTVIAYYGDAIINWMELLLVSIWIAIKGDVLLRYYDLDRVLAIGIMFPYEMAIPEGFNNAYTFIEALSRGRSYDASDARDHIYTFLSHPCARWGDKLFIEPNYTKTVQKLYIEVALWILEHTRDLRILTMAGNRVKIDLDRDIPSWAPEWNVPVYWQPILEDKYTAAGSELCEISYFNGSLKIRSICFEVILDNSETMFNNEFLVTFTARRWIQV
jgi:hypothetical protein